jgi:pantoate kinase
LDADGNLPLFGLGFGYAFTDAVIDPIGGKDTYAMVKHSCTIQANDVLTKCVEELVKAADLATQFFRRHFAREHGYNNTTSSQTYTSDEASSKEGSERMRVDGLNDGSDNEYSRTQY